MLYHAGTCRNYSTHVLPTYTCYYRMYCTLLHMHMPWASLWYIVISIMGSYGQAT